MHTYKALHSICHGFIRCINDTHIRLAIHQQQTYLQVPTVPTTTTSRISSTTEPMNKPFYAFVAGELQSPKL